MNRLLGKFFSRFAIAWLLSLFLWVTVAQADGSCCVCDLRKLDPHHCYSMKNEDTCEKNRDSEGNNNCKWMDTCAPFDESEKFDHCAKFFKNRNSNCQISLWLPINSVGDCGSYDPDIYPSH